MTKRVVISMTEEMHEELSKLSRDRGVPISYLVREAAAAYLERSKIRIVDIHPGWGGPRGPAEG